MNKGFIIAIIFIIGAAAIGALLYFVSGTVPVSLQTPAQFPSVSQQITNPAPAVPLQQSCEDYYKSDCPDSCSICPDQADGTIEEATCHTNDFCTSLGYEENWYLYQVDA